MPRRESDNIAAGRLCATRVIKEGHLIKSALGRSRFGAINWKQRWFVLSADGLRYYKDEDATTKKASGVLPLNQICMIEAVAEIQTPTTTHGHFEGRAPLFQIGFVDGSKHRLLLVQTVDDFDRDEWIRALRSQFPRRNGIPWSIRFHTGVQTGKDTFSCCGSTQPRGCTETTMPAVPNDCHDYEVVVPSKHSTMTAKRAPPPRSTPSLPITFPAADAGCDSPYTPSMSSKGYQNAEIKGGVTVTIASRAPATPKPSPRRSKRSHLGVSPTLLPPSRSPEATRRAVYTLPTESVEHDHGSGSDAVGPEGAEYTTNRPTVVADTPHEYEVVDFGEAACGSGQAMPPQVSQSSITKDTTGKPHEYETLLITTTRLPLTPGGYSKLDRVGELGDHGIAMPPPPPNPRLPMSASSRSGHRGPADINDETSWHVHSMSRDAVKRALLQLPDGSFVVRDSSSDLGSGAVVLCIRVLDEVAERKIAKEGRRFLILEPGIGIKRFTSLVAVVTWVVGARRPAASSVLATQHRYANETVLEPPPTYASPNSAEMHGYGSDNSGDEAD